MWCSSYNKQNYRWIIIFNFWEKIVLTLIIGNGVVSLKIRERQELLTTETESTANLDIDDDCVTENDLASDSESVEWNVLAAV